MVDVVAGLNMVGVSFDESTTSTNVPLVQPKKLPHIGMVESNPLNNTGVAIGKYLIKVARRVHDEINKPTGIAAANFDFPTQRNEDYGVDGNELYRKVNSGIQLFFTQDFRMVAQKTAYLKSITDPRDLRLPMAQQDLADTLRRDDQSVFEGITKYRELLAKEAKNIMQADGLTTAMDDSTKAQFKRLDAALEEAVADAYLARDRICPTDLFNCQAMPNVKSAAAATPVAAR